MNAQTRCTAPRSCTECAVRDRAICAALDDGELQALNVIGRRRRLTRGEALIWAGSEAPPCANVIEGVLKLGVATADGREQAVGLAGPGDFIGQPFGAEAPFTVTALGDAELCVFPRSGFARALDAHPRLERRLLERTLASLDGTRGQIVAIASGSARERVVGLLLDLADRAGVDGDERFELALTRGEMAELLGLTIETVSRQLTALKRTGAIALFGARGMALLDRDALAMEPIVPPMHRAMRESRHL